MEDKGRVTAGDITRTAPTKWQVFSKSASTFMILGFLSVLLLSQRYTHI